MQNRHMLRLDAGRQRANYTALMTLIPASHKIEVVAHRGLHITACENTMDAFEQAVQAGADALELDVHATADGIIVVHHDAGIPPTAGNSVVIATSTGQEVAAAALAANFRIPTLAEVMQQFTGRAKLYLEVKAMNIELLVARILRSVECEIAVHSFDHRIAQRVRDLVPALQTGILIVGRPVFPAKLVADAAATDYWPRADFVDRDLVTEVHGAGGRVIVWTPNTQPEWKRMIDLRVDGICTDRPDLLCEWLAG